MSEQVASQSENVQETTPVDEQKSAVNDALEMFGISAPKAEESAESESTKSETEPPATETTESEQSSETKKLKVKHNHQEIEVDEDKIPELVEKGMALDKYKERSNDYEKALDRVAKLAGYENHEAYVKDLDRIEQEAQKKRENDYNDLRTQLLEDLELNGVDRGQAEAYLENHPLLQQAKEALKEKETLVQQQAQAKQAEEWSKQWTELYSAHPDLTETSKVFDEGKDPEWYTTDMKAKIERGYSPLDAYRLAHMDQIQTQTKKQTQQEVIKQQMLNKRSQVETDTNADLEPEVNPELTSAFSMFGLDPKAAKKYAKK